MTSITSCIFRIVPRPVLLGTSACAVGLLSQSASTEPWFVEMAAARGLQFVHQSGHTGDYLLPEIITGGGALFDMDGDGDLDAYLVQGGSLHEAAARTGNRLYRNRGGGWFDDVTAGSGAEVREYGMGVAVGDYDNDGDNDLYVTNYGRNVLLRNDGTGRFTDVTAIAGVGASGWSTSAAFFDYDADGDLDLFVTRYVDWSPRSERRCYNAAGAPDYCSPKIYNAPSPDVLYRNNGDGTFSDVSKSAGIQASVGNGLGVTTGDFNADGRVDVYVANDGTPNHLWLNTGGGRFEEAAFTLGCAVDLDGNAKAGMGVHALDVDWDGDLDIVVVNLEGEADSFYRNDGAFFIDDTAAAGLRTVSRPFTRFGMALADFDNDQIYDLYEANGRVLRQAIRASPDPYAEPNLLLRGLAGGRFESVVPPGGTARPLVSTSRSAVFGDVDDDGGIDILIVNRDGPVHLLRNVVADRGHWTSFRVLDEHGRDALNAEVTLTVSGRQVKAAVASAYSYLASNDPRVHFGLGKERIARDVTVRWIDGQRQSFGDFDGNRTVTLRRSKDVRRRSAGPR